MRPRPAPFVTVGIPFHDEEEYLDEAIASVLRQTYSDFELLLVDDGSSDRSLEIAQSFTSDPRVRVLSDGVRRRLPARLNQIVDEARGEVVARMDADDISHPDRLARELALFEGDGTLDIVGTWAALIDERRRTLAVLESPDETPTLRGALERGLLVHASVVGRRAWFRSHRYDEQLWRAQDRDLWCRSIDGSHFGVVPAPLYLIRSLPRTEEFVADYRETQRQNRMLVRRYGWEAHGISGATRAYLGSFAKSAIMTLAVRAGLGARLVRRRGRSPTAAESLLIQEALTAGMMP